VYPFWKVCTICQNPFPTYTKEQALRNKTCSKECASKSISKNKKGKVIPPELCEGKVLITCPVCGKNVWEFRRTLKRVETPTCSRQCNGVLRGEEWRKHAHKGRANWTKESEQKLVERMTGENNPAWKGGVTYFKKKGNYTGVKYVRCPEPFLPMARKDGYVMEHRLIVAQHLGRMLKRTEVVHHIDHDPTNNDPANLMLFPSNSAHKKYEATGKPEPLWRLSKK
jgi:endogenous inhibitor of DNA gyrase (YacG/DUF329 family)